MKKVPKYLKDPYLKELKTQVTSIESTSSDLSKIILEDTIFYPTGGGQGCDQGEIVAADGKMIVNEVKYEDGQIVHIGSLSGEIKEGDEVEISIDWDRRYQNMIVHTAGHVIDEILFRMNLSPDKLKPMKAYHGSNPYVLYEVKEEVELTQKELNKKIKEFISKDIDIHWSFVSSDKELKEKSRFIINIPDDKPLRIVSFGDEKGMPDGGTLLKNTDQIPDMHVEEIEVADKDDKNTLKISYTAQTEIEGSDQDLETDQESSNNSPNAGFAEIEELESMIEDDFDVDSTNSYSELKTKYFGKKGEIKKLLRSIGDKDENIRSDFGKAANLLRSQVERKLEEFKKRAERIETSKALTEEAIDVTAPFDVNMPTDKRPDISSVGTLHPITQIGEKALEIFKLMGFHVAEARKLDNDYNVFEALNIPKGHPARDMWDTFWTDQGLIPTTHTSAMQNRLISGQEAPIREVIVGRCFRNEATDASHEHTFYQVEGICVDEDIKLSDLIGTLSAFMNEFYGRDVKYRIQPSYFPFVEPGIEFMIECLVCSQRGCPFCGYSGWVELVPGGMIHPNVLRHAGKDPEKYSGFAWGLGYDRLVMLQSQIQDIRNIHSGNLNFLKQFK
jgi:phenylalanyl-tRNA synthetase alpha chain